MKASIKRQQHGAHYYNDICFDAVTPSDGVLTLAPSIERLLRIYQMVFDDIRADWSTRQKYVLSAAIISSSRYALNHADKRSMDSGDAIEARFGIAAGSDAILPRPYRFTGRID